MKSQLDLIVSIVALVLMGVAVGVSLGTQRPVPTPPPPPTVDLSAPKLPEAQVTYTNGLSGSNNPAAGARR